jgi:hypothetical protein
MKGRIARSRHSNAVRELAVRLAAIRGGYEAAFMFLVLVAVEWMIPGHASLARLSPHPFWIPVVLISALYGAQSGLSVAAAAIALSWVVGWPEQGGQEDFYAYSMRVWREPILWLLASLLLGCLRDGQLKQRDELIDEVERLCEQRTTVVAFAEDLQRSLEDRERMIATWRSDLPETAFLRLHALRTAKADDVIECLKVSMRTLVGEAEWVFYPAEPGDMPIVAFPCPRSGQEKFRRRAARAALADAVRRGKSMLSVTEASDSLVLDGVGVFAALVRNGARRIPFGILVVEVVAPSRLNVATAEATLHVAMAFAAALETHQSFGKPGVRIADPAPRRAESGLDSPHERIERPRSPALAGRL